MKIMFTICFRDNPYYQYVKPSSERFPNNSRATATKNLNSSSTNSTGASNNSNHQSAPHARGRARERNPGKRKTYNFEGTFFDAIGSRRKEEFTIHPEWVSEGVGISVVPPRRAKSAPPPRTRSRNIITWES